MKADRDHLVFAVPLTLTVTIVPGGPAVGDKSTVGSTAAESLTVSGAPETLTVSGARGPKFIAAKPIPVNEATMAAPTTTATTTFDLADFDAGLVSGN